MIRWQPVPTQRKWMLALLIVVGVIGAIELILFLPRVLQAWYPYDYGRYVAMGNALRADPHSYGARPIDTWYPLPAQLWVFVPLSLMPDWFRLIWVLFPLAYILRRLGAAALFLFLFPPLWFAVGDGMIDLWLIVPLVWMLENRPGFAGLGVVLTFVKPQVTLLAALYLLARWIVARDRRNLLAFGGALIVFCLPAFILQPDWILKMLAALPERAGEGGAQIQLLIASVWAWWRIGGLGYLIFGAFALALAILFWRAFRRARVRVGAVQLLNLALMPVLYAGSAVTVIPLFRKPRELIALVLAALGAYWLDRALGGFGGGYALVPLVALHFLSRDSAPGVTG